MWEELLKEIAVIKWTLICVAVSLWGLTAYLLLKELSVWWHNFDKKKKPFTLEQMKKDLAAAERPRTERSRRTKWD